MKKILNILYFLGITTLLLFVYFNFKEENPKIEITNTKGYVGPQKCMECHKDHYTNSINTAHFKTTQKASEETLPPIFEGEKGVFVLARGQVLKLERDGPDFVENMYLNNQLVKKMYFDIILGSGKIGQDYIAQYNQQLFLLVSHYLKKTESLTLRPGQPLDSADYHRISPVFDACLQCHTTFVEKENLYPELSPEAYPDWQVFRDKHRLKKNYILGVTCESCHGPGQNHIKQMESDPYSKITQITNPLKLTRQRNIQICAYCHSGIGQPLKPMFSFRPGDNLNEFFSFDLVTLETANPHANNVVLLQKSECFKKSNMTCITCHNVHRQERGNKSLFSLKCLGCHSVKDHINVTNIDGTFKENCIDCHMPMEEWEHKYITNDSKIEGVSFRTHFIQKLIQKNHRP